MRDARVEDVEHVSDSDSEEKNDDTRNHLTVAIYPQHQVTGVRDHFNYYFCRVLVVSKNIHRLTNLVKFKSIQFIFL